MEILETFGVQPVLLFAQIVNFVILLLILKKFAYKPIMKVLDDRKHKIETSMKQAEEIEKKLAVTEKRQTEILGNAERESTKIIEEAKNAAQKIQESTLVETNKKVEETLVKNKAALKLEGKRMVSEVKANMVVLVTETTKKVLGKVLSSRDKEDLVKKSLEELKS